MMRKFIVLAALSGLIAPVSGQEYKSIWNFDSLNFAGSYNGFQRAPSAASVYLNDSIFSGYGGRSLQINARKDVNGYCGAWINFFTYKNGKPQYVNAGANKYLALRIRGQVGHEQVQIQMSDRQLMSKEDSRPCKTTETYLPNGITTGWQQLLIPLSDFNGINPVQLAGITFNFTTPGNFTIYIDDLCLLTDARTELPLSNIQHPVSGNKPLENALWVWQTHKLFNNLEYRDQFFSTCHRLQVKHVYMQLFYDDNLTELKYADSLRSVVKACTQHQIFVYGLDGSPEWGCYDKHEVPLQIVKLIAAYNSKSAVDEKLKGVHFDIEPYLLLGFNIPEMKQQIIYENLDLKQKLSTYCHAHQLTLGVDIPFWYEDPDSTGVPVTNILFNNTTQAASFHMIDMADDVAIMGYRNFAYGSDGMISKDLDELTYAGKQPGKKIWAGVETIVETPMPFILFSGIKKNKLSAFLSDNPSTVGRRSRFKGYRLLMLEHEGYVHLGLEQTTSKKKNVKRHHQLAVQELKELLEAYTDSSDKGANSRSLAAYLTLHPEWVITKQPQARHTIGVWKATVYPTDVKLSFAGHTLEEMLLELYKASVAFYDYPAFRGFAFHCYETILEMK